MQTQNGALVDTQSSVRNRGRRYVSEDAMRTAMPASGHEVERAADEREPESCRRRRGGHDRSSGGVSVHGLAKAREETGCTTRR